jgi:hypothetical protein
VGEFRACVSIEGEVTLTIVSTARSSNGVRGLTAFARRGAPLVVVLLASCNGILGIGEPLDPLERSGGAAGTMETRGGTDSGAAHGGTGNNEQGGISGTADGGGEGGEAGAAGGASGNGGMGETGGTGTIAPLGIATATLPNARLNVRFEFQLEASGGTGGPYVWSANDDLPDGLELSDDGTLRGVPAAKGTFEFEVTVTETRTGRRATKDFDFEVIRRRWLVYQSDEEEVTRQLLYAVDVENPTATKLAIVSELAPHTDTTSYSFSPDGNYLAYLADTAYDNVYNLYVVDMSGEQPGNPRLVGNAEVTVIRHAWSPNSKFIAYLVGTEPTGHPFDAVYADVTQPTRVTRIDEATISSMLGWVSDDIFVFAKPLEWYVYTRLSAENYVPRRLDFEALLSARHSELPVALFRGFNGGCTDTNWHMVDFGTDPPAVREFVEGYVSPSPGFEYVAHLRREDGRYHFYRPSETQSIGSFGAALDQRLCSPGGWSSDGSVFVAGGDGDRLVVTALRNDFAQSEVLPGAYGPVGVTEPPVFSRNDEWLGFATETGVFVARNDSGDIGPVFAVDPAARPSEPISDSLVRFSPDSAFIAYAETHSTNFAPQAFIADLRTGEPNGEVLSAPDTLTGDAITEFAWSIHSTEIAMLVHRPPSAQANLYLVTEPKSSNRAITRLNGPLTCDRFLVCQTVHRFAFQP